MDDRILRGRVALITGSTCGIGLHVAKKLYSLGASVIITYRSEERGRDAVAALLEHCPAIEEQCVMMFELDLCSLASVDQFCEEVLSAVRSLDILVCNAGVMGLPFELTSNSVESHFATNQLGHFSLVRQLLPALERSPEPAPRIIIVSSGFYKQANDLRSRKEIMGECIWDYSPNAAYANSKLANCLFANELARRLEQRGSKVRAFAVRPGFVRGTELGRQTSWILRSIATPLVWAFSTSLDKGIQGIVHCILSPVDQLAHGGLYHGTELEEYTLVVTAENAQRLWRQCERIETLIAERSHGKLACPREIEWKPLAT